MFEQRFAALEGGSAALATSSGMAAIFYATINLAEMGDNIVASKKLYGGTVTLFSSTLKRFGIEARFFDPAKPEEVKNLVDANTKMIFFESITNPSIDVPDFKAIADIANDLGVVTVVDNTVSDPDPVPSFRARLRCHGAQRQQIHHRAGACHRRDHRGTRKPG